jgi:hypothetical protein
MSSSSPRGEVGTSATERPGEARASSAAEFPANKEKCSEFPAFRPIRGRTVRKSPTILGSSGKIPCAGEQGFFLPNREFKFPVPPKTGIIVRLFRPAAPGCPGRQPEPCGKAFMAARRQFDPEFAFPVGPGTEGMRRNAVEGATVGLRQERPSLKQDADASVRPEVQHSFQAIECREST